MRSMNRWTTKEKSSGEWSTAMPGYSLRAQRNPAGVVTDRTTRDLFFAQGWIRDLRLRTSPTDTAWIQTVSAGDGRQLRPQPALQQRR